MIVQTVKFPVITTMTRTERTVAQVIAIVSGYLGLIAWTYFMMVHLEKRKKK